MTTLRVDELSVRYPTRSEQALENVSLAVGEREIVSITGRTGAGKSTLCLAAAGLLPRVVRATVSGRVVVGEVVATDAKASDLVGKVGIVFSSPALQLSASKPTVREELAFGLENLCVPRTEMEARIDAVMDGLRIGHLAERDPLTLSGGEQQRVAIASIVVMGTAVVVLDEPAAQLDPQGKSDISTLLREMANDGRAVLVAEHSPDVLAAADRCLILQAGRALTIDQPGAALASEKASAAGVEVPTLVSLAATAGLPSGSAFDEERIATALAGRRGNSQRPRAPTDSAPQIAAGSVRGAQPVVVSAHGLVYRYAGGVEAVRGVDLEVNPGSTVAIVGQNGSGKTTLIKHLNGLLRPSDGHVLLDGRDTANQPVSDLARQVGFVFQNPDDQLFNSRVDREIAFGPRNLRLETEQIERLVESALEMTGLGAQRATNPYDLDVSVRKLVALAGVLAMEPPVLVLDEPTMSQDGPGTRRIGAIVDAWAAAGRTVIAVTHDMEFAARHFRRIVVMRAGEVVLDGPPSDVFAAPNTALLATTGLRPPPLARIGARLGLAQAPTDANALFDALAAR